MLKKRLMMPHCFYRQSVFVRVLQNLVARHDAPLHFIQDDLPPKLDQRTAFVAGNGAGMRLK